MAEGTTPRPLFDFAAVFNVDDHMAYYGDSLTDERTDAEVSGLVSLLELSAPLRILDLACGFGRHANRLAVLGHAVTGIDLVDGFLQIARQDAVAREATVDYRQGDMLHLDFDAEFDLVLLLFTAFGYFEDEGNLLVLKNIARALKPGGRLLLDVPNRDSTLKNLRPYLVSEKGGTLLIDRNSFDTLTGRWSNQRILIQDGVRKDMPFSIRLYNPTEMAALLPQAGLELARLCGGWDGSPVSSDSRRMIVIARKPV
jgi:SAM-dependent methyltransferase